MDWIQKVKSWLSLVRFGNTLMGIIVAVLIYHGMFFHMLQVVKDDLALPMVPFLLFLLALGIMIMSANIINDIQDQQTDTLNQKNRTIIRGKISVDKAQRIYFALLIIGNLIALLLSLYLRKWFLFFLYPGFAVLLHLYSKRLKSSVIWGNICIAIMGLCIPWVLVVGEWYAFNKHSEQFNHLHSAVLEWLIWVSLFMGLSMFCREVIKDIEDVLGDKESGIRTLATVFGVERSLKVFQFFWSLLLLSFTIYILSIFSIMTLSFMFLSVIPCFMLMWWIVFKSYRCISTQDWHNLSQWIKVSMGMGLIFIYWIAVLSGS